MPLFPTFPFPVDTGDITGFEKAGELGELIEVGFFGLVISAVLPLGLEINCFQVSFLSFGESSCNGCVGWALTGVFGVIWDGGICATWTGQGPLTGLAGCWDMDR